MRFAKRGEEHPAEERLAGDDKGEARAPLDHPWSYKVYACAAGDQLEDELNEYGALGWELLAILPFSTGATAAGPMGFYRCIFKRGTVQPILEKPVVEPKHDAPRHKGHS